MLRRPRSNILVASLDAFHMKVRDVIKLMAADGLYLARTRGSYRQFEHLRKKGLVTIAGHPSDELAPGTLNSVLKQAGLK